MCAAEPLFSDQDKALMDSLVFDPALKPEYNPVSNCLSWDDEVPQDISYSGLNVVRRLWMARGYLHKGQTIEDHFLNPHILRHLWEQATDEIPDWPGFKRLVLNKAEKAYFQEWLGVENPFD